jgi:hypothetical protein
MKLTTTFSRTGDHTDHALGQFQISGLDVHVAQLLAGFDDNLRRGVETWSARIKRRDMRHRGRRRRAKVVFAGRHRVEPVLPATVCRPRIYNVDRDSACSTETYMNSLALLVKD